MRETQTRQRPTKTTNDIRSFSEDTNKHAKPTRGVLSTQTNAAPFLGTRTIATDPTKNKTPLPYVRDRSKPITEFKARTPICAPTSQNTARRTSRPKRTRNTLRHAIISKDTIHRANQTTYTNRHTKRAKDAQKAHINSGHIPRYH